MKFILITLSVAATALLFWFCKTTKYTADKLPKEQIRFGRGGGIVGRETAYTLLENGQLFGQNIEGGTAELASAQKRVSKGYFKTIETLELAQLDFQHPGNVYSFIEVPTKDGQPRRIIWGDSKYPVDGPVQDIFNKLMDLVPKKD